MSSINQLQQRALEMAAKKAELSAAIRAKNNQQAREHLLRIQVALSQRPTRSNSYGDLPANSAFQTTGLRF